MHWKDDSKNKPYKILDTPMIYHAKVSRRDRNTNEEKRKKVDLVI